LGCSFLKKGYRKQREISMVNKKRMCSFFIIYTGVDPEYILILLIFCMMQVVN